MAKRGRKPGRARTGYWYEEQDAAFREFLTTDDINRKEELYNTILKPAFTKLVESIIRRYNLYVPNEPFEDTFNDTLSFIMSKIEHFNPNSGFKSFSYVGTICKNYLIYKINTADKLKKRNTSYDGFNNEEMSGISDALRYSYDDTTSSIPFLTELLKQTAKNVKDILDKPIENKLTEGQIRVGNALYSLLTNWENLFARMGSDKFNKSSILLYLKETTFLTTKEIRDNLKIFKLSYYDLKKDLLEDGIEN